MSKPIRESNIELCRIFAILGIIILHYNNKQIGGALAYVEYGSVNEYILVILESVFVCGVDLFVLISGYFMINSNCRSVMKPLRLIAQVIVFNEGIYFVSVILGKEKCSIKSFIGNAIPVNYFVVLYVALYFVSPILNVGMQKMSEKSLKIMMILCVLIFSVEPTLVDVMEAITGSEFQGLSAIGMYGSEYGYSIMNFILMYMLGGYIRIKRCKLDLKTSTIIFMILVMFLAGWSRIDTETAWEYCNPLVISEAIVIFLFSKNLKICNVVINHLAKGAFTVFLLHGIFINHLKIESAVKLNPILLLVHILISSISIYIICWCMYWIYGKITEPICKRVDKSFLSKEFIID